MITETITWKGREGPMDLVVGPATFRPSTVSYLLAEALDFARGSVVIDAGCGSGVLSIVAAKLGAGEVYGVDAADGTAEIASANAQTHRGLRTGPASFRVICSSHCQRVCEPTC
jgi:predicted RNA methylase